MADPSDVASFQSAIARKSCLPRDICQRVLSLSDPMKLATAYTVETMNYLGNGCRRSDRNYTFFFESHLKTVTRLAGPPGRVIVNLRRNEQQDRVEYGVCRVVEWTPKKRRVPVKANGLQTLPLESLVESLEDWHDSAAEKWRVRQELQSDYAALLQVRMDRYEGGVLASWGPVKVTLALTEDVLMPPRRKRNVRATLYMTDPDL